MMKIENWKMKSKQKNDQETTPFRAPESRFHCLCLRGAYNHTYYPALWQAKFDLLRQASAALVHLLWVPK